MNIGFKALGRQFWKTRWHLRILERNILDSIFGGAFPAINPDPAKVAVPIPN
jgi:hypothetical protein